MIKVYQVRWKVKGKTWNQGAYSVPMSKTDAYKMKRRLNRLNSSCKYWVKKIIINKKETIIYENGNKYRPIIITETKL